jgi:hypothetical protein
VCNFVYGSGRSGIRTRREDGHDAVPPRADHDDLHAGPDRALHLRPRNAAALLQEPEAAARPDGDIDRRDREEAERGGAEAGVRDPARVKRGTGREDRDDDILM